MSLVSERERWERRFGGEDLHFLHRANRSHAALALPQLREPQDQKADGKGHSGGSALIDLVASKPAG